MSDMTPATSHAMDDSPTPDTPPVDKRELRRILASSFLGSMVEFYDFLLYASAAAIVFHEVFFSGLPHGVAVFASFGTLAAGYIARPLGAVVFGHFGDRVGRKTVLVTSMVLMGLATTAIGLLPGTATIGVAAPVILVLLRVIQGIAVGGEWGGAMTIAMEHAPGGRRGFAASFASMGAPAGALLGTLAMSAVASLPDDQFLTWGWRLPFLLSVVLVVIGLFVRLKVSESPLFQRFESEAEERRLPIAEVARHHLPKVGLGMMVGTGMFTIAGLATVWGVSIAVENGADRSAVLDAKAAAALATLVATFASARLCDIYGRRPMITIGLVGMALFAFPFLALATSGSEIGFLIAVVVAQSLQGLIGGAFGAFLGELFPTSVRFTAASLCYQGASTIGAGLAPSAAAALLLLADGSTVLIGAAWVLVAVLSVVAAWRSREGMGVADLDRDLAVHGKGTGNA